MIDGSSTKDYWNDPNEADLWTNPEMHHLTWDLRKSNIVGNALGQFPELSSSRSEILDICSGGGLHLSIPGVNNNKITAIDISKHALAKNPAKHKLVRDVSKGWWVKRGHFDVATIMFSNRYFANQAHLLREAGIALKSGGRVIMLDHSTLGHPQEKAFFDPNELKNLRAADGFTNIEIAQLMPQEIIPEDNVFHGPLLLFTAVKK